MASSRYSRHIGATSYRSYVARLRASPPNATNRTGGERISVFVASCTGAKRLSCEIGLPLACIGVSRDPRSRIAELASNGHGSIVPFGSMSSFDQEAGWDDWAPMHLRPEMAEGATLATGVHLVRGAIEIAGAPHEVGEVEAALVSILAHIRFQDFGSRAVVTEARMAAGGPMLLTPRYTSVAPRGTIVRVDDLFVFDPWRDLRLLGARVEAALGDVASRKVSVRPSRMGLKW